MLFANLKLRALLSVSMFKTKPSLSIDGLRSYAGDSMQPSFVAMKLWFFKWSSVLEIVILKIISRHS
jgi:hypothetical protein